MTVVLVDPRRPSLVPVEAIDLLTGDVQYTEEMPVKMPWSLPAERPTYDGDEAPVLVSSDPNHPAVKARLAAGDKLIAAPDAAPGERLVDAVAMMDKLRTSGPWEGEQTHDSLRRYLLEETYEVFDAVRGGNADELRDELGDVLLQVLFHARIAEDAPAEYLEQGRLELLMLLALNAAILDPHFRLLDVHADPHDRQRRQYAEDQ